MDLHLLIKIQRKSVAVLPRQHPTTSNVQLREAVCQAVIKVESGKKCLSRIGNKIIKTTGEESRPTDRTCLQGKVLQVEV